MKCKACGSEVPEGASYCIQCGVHLETGSRANGDAPDSAVYPLLAAANLFRMRGNWEAAEAKCIEVLRLYPNNATAHSLLGDVYANQDRWDDAVQWYQLAIDLDPDNNADRSKLDQARQQVAGAQAPKLQAEEVPAPPKQRTFGARFSPLMQLAVIALLSFVVVLLLMSMRGTPGFGPLRDTDGSRDGAGAASRPTPGPPPSAGLVPANPAPPPTTGSSSGASGAMPPTTPAPPAATGSAAPLVPTGDMGSWEAAVFSQLQTDTWLSSRPMPVQVVNIIVHPVEGRVLVTAWFPQAPDLRSEGPRVAYRIGQVLAHNNASRFEVLLKAPVQDSRGPQAVIVAAAENVGPRAWSDDPGTVGVETLLPRFRDIWWHTGIR